MKIQVLGSGCATCKKLYEITQKAVIGLDANVEYITGPEGVQLIMELGAMGSPVLSVDGKIAMVGFTPNVEEIKEAIVTASHE